MQDTFSSRLFDIIKDSPHLQEALIRSMQEGGGYTIPVRPSIPEDIGGVMDPENIEYEKRRELEIESISKVDQLTIGGLSERLTQLHDYPTEKEAKGEKLSPLDKTLKDIDITHLAILAFLGA